MSLLILTGNKDVLTSQLERDWGAFTEIVPGTRLEHIRDPLQYMIRHYVFNAEFIGRKGNDDVFYYRGWFYNHAYDSTPVTSCPINNLIIGGAKVIATLDEARACTCAQKITSHGVFILI